MPIMNPYQNYYQNMPQYQPQQQIPQQQMPQIQNGGFVSVRNETEAMNYPVAHGMSVTFKDETAPYIYTKTMGFSQMDRPTFEKYKLVKEDIKVNEPQEEPKNTVLDDVKSEISALWGEINALKEQPKKPYVNKKKEDGGD